MKFSHLHCHTQFSLLDGAADIKSLFKKAAADGMPAVAMTDHGNMFGAFNFVNEAYNHKDENGNLKVKPIVGCEFYLVENRHKRAFTKEERDVRYHQLMLAKNEEGYRNLVKLCSLGYIEGLYGKYPRIDKELILQYNSGLIATTCCIGAEVPKTILKKGEKEAEEVFKWWLDIFGENYFVELQRHKMPEQEKVNEVLLRFARKYNVPIIASNDSHYVDREDANAHDILLCINTGEKQSTPTMKEFSDDDVSMKNKRFAFYNDEFYFKKTEEMSTLFADIPEAIDNTNLVIDKIDQLKLTRDILLPHFPIPSQYKDQDDYLEFLTWEGAKQRYVEITPEIDERLRFELFTIRTMGFAGYFLIVSDFIKAGRDMGVFVGPGRGSAAGSVVAYCIGITNIDPIKYQLLFERFLNPERKSMPDIDTDFDDEGRQQVINYVVEKYGFNQVAHIVTYGTMAAKMSIKDVARVMDLPLSESNALAKLVPDKPGISLKRVLHAPIEGEKSLTEKEGIRMEDVENVKRIREVYESSSLDGIVMREAEKLEGSVRGTGIHAAGIIIAPQDLTGLIPVCRSKDVPLLITQFDGSVIENAGVIKMDFLGLKTLTIIKDALRLIKKNYGVDISIDDIPLTDPKTFELYQRGETNATFQFESTGMQKYLRDLKPDKFEDLIAMNALYRPGPLEYIPNFIARKHGHEPITYDLPAMEEYLADTYGITVYQEQVMLLSQKLAGFSKGDADVLRKAMGKKQIAVLNKMKTQFVDGAVAKGHDAEKLNKIWTDWEAFASYAFNKSHSTCYAFVAYQTAFLKAHYPGEFMAAVLNNQNNIEKISFYMEECQRMGLDVLGPDVNESEKGFSVNKNSVVRFGLNAIKGVGEGAVENLLEEREKKGMFKDIFDLIKRVNQRAVNKKSMESLILAGAMDCFPELHRAQYFQAGADNINNLEKIMRFGNQYSSSKSQVTNSLFGAMDMPEIAPPALLPSDPWTLTEKLEKEKDMVGIYISGHPLDGFRFEMKNYSFKPILEVQQEREELLTFMQEEMRKVTDGKRPRFNEKTFRIAGFISEPFHGMSRMGTSFGRFKLADYSGNIEFNLWDNDYVNFNKYLLDNEKIIVTGVLSPYIDKRDGSAKVSVKVKQIMLLSEAKSALTTRLLVRLPLESINSVLVKEFTDIVNQSPGECELYVSVFDKENNWESRLKSHSGKFTVNNDFIQWLAENEQVTYDVQSN